MDMSLSKLQETVKDKGARRAAVHGVAKSQIWLSDQTIWTDLETLYLVKTAWHRSISTAWFRLDEVPRTGRFTGRDRQHTRGPQRLEGDALLFNGHSISVQDKENVLEVDSDNDYPALCIWWHGTVHVSIVKMINNMLCTFFIKKSNMELWFGFWNIKRVLVG